MPQCSAFNCKNIGVHLFPKDPKRRKQWESAIRIKKFKASKTARLCAAHFKEEDYFGKSKYTNYEPLARFLKKTAVPSVFCFTKIKPENPSAIERQHRLERRCQKELSQEHHQDLNKNEPQPSTSHITEESYLSPVVSCEIEITTEKSSEPMSSSDVCDFNSKSTQVDHEHPYGSINRCKNNDKIIQFYTGFESYKKFYLVYSTLSPMVNKIKYYGSNIINLSPEDQFFLTLMKLRQNKCNFELSLFFNISESTVSNIFITWVNFIYQLWTKICIWPEKELVQYYSPGIFKNYDPNIRVILDGTKIKIQKPKDPKSHQAFWSSTNNPPSTLKILVGATPGGLLSYCSQAYAGSTSDRQAVEQSDLLTKCESGDSVLADRGLIKQDMFAHKNVDVRIPTLLKGKSQLPGLKVIKDTELSNKKVHIERIIGLTKTYKILRNELDHKYVPIASKIFFICFMCCNFQEGIKNNMN